MSSYATLSLGPAKLGQTSDYIDPGIMWIFRPSDKLVERIDRRDREQLAKYVMEEYLDEYDEDNPFTRVEYRCAARVARDRLDLKGFTYEVARASFATGLKDKIQRYEELVKRTPGLFDEDLRVLRSLTVENWVKALGRILKEDLTRQTLDRLSDSDDQLPLLRHMFGPPHDFYGFTGLDLRNFARLVIEEVSPDEQLIYDLSDLAAGGWIDEVDDLVAHAEALTNTDFLLAQRVIILTEGDTDRRILERSLKLLYPHLADYFHFFDFTGKKAGGGVGDLANLVRAFAAADVRHRVLALFDNDTAARAALSNVSLEALPNNIAIRHYPNLPMAQQYPTLGPSGETRMDVNGLAGSIELYLGEDILRNADDLLSPVQWTGYERKVAAYQGKVIDKKRIQQEFDKKLALCEANPEEVGSHDWEGIRAILDTMRTAFHDIDAEAILSGAIYE